MLFNAPRQPNLFSDITNSSELHPIPQVIVMKLYASVNQFIIGSVNGLLPVQRQVISWTIIAN